MKFLKPFGRKKWSRRENIFLLERLEMYLLAGLTLDRAFLAAGDEVSLQRRQTLEALRNIIEQGGAVSSALREHVGISSTIASLIRHGELSGELSKTINMARLLMEKEEELIRKCLSALAYPVIIGVFAGLLTIGLLQGVMPQIIPMLKSLHVPLPLLTRMVMAISQGFLSYGVYVIIGSIVAVIAFSSAYARYISVRKKIHSLLIKIPFAGRIIKYYHLSIFLRSVGALLGTGLPLVSSYSIVAGSIGLIPLRETLELHIPEIHRGISICSIFKNSFVPEYVAPLVSAGERSGMLGPSLDRAASVLDRDIDHSLKRMTALVEPVMMAAMGCIVGAIALSIMMPIYDISKVLQK